MRIKHAKMAVLVMLAFSASGCLNYLIDYCEGEDIPAQCAEFLCVDGGTHPICETDASPVTADGGVDADVPSESDAEIDSGPMGCDDCDAGMDGATDATPDPDGGPECDAEHPCEGDASVCASGVCVVCTADGAGCPAERPVCDEGGQRCVECTADGQCPSERPVCDRAGGVCAGCTDSMECARLPQRPVCDGSSGACVQCTSGEADACGEQVCLDGGSVCVECNVHSDCSDPAKAKCDSQTNTCVPCDGAGQCTGIEGTEVCALDTQTCVQCTAGDATACGDDVCASRDEASLGAVKNQCLSGVEPGAADLCDACVSDAHCGSDAVCAAERFEDTDVGYFCLPRLSDGQGCAVDHRPFFNGVNVVGDPVSSLDGSVVPFCQLGLTTCQALRDFRSKSCMDANDHSACGVEGLSDGYCQEVETNPGLFLCTVPCLGELDCRLGSACTDDGGIGRAVCGF